MTSYFLIFLALVALHGCSADNACTSAGAGGDQTSDKPSCPNSEATSPASSEPTGASASSSSTSAATQQSKRTTANTTDTQTSNASKPSLCLDKCDTPEGLQFSFSTALPITPNECNVRKMKALDNSLGLTIVYLADCGEGNQLYMKVVSYDGTYQGSSQKISADCLAAYTVVADFDADLSTIGPLVAYRCSADSLKIAAYDQSGALTGKTTLSRDFTYHPDLYVVWNATAGAFGLITYGSLLRFDPRGRPLGGSTGIANNNSNTIDYVMVQGGSWILMTKSYSSYYCSKVSPLGLPQCNEHYATSQRNGRPLGHLSLSSYDSTFYLSSFDASTCTMSDSRVLGDTNESSIAAVYNVTALQDNINAVLFRSPSNTLLIGIYGGSPPGSLISVVAVADLSSTFASPKLQVIRNHLLVSYVNSGRGYVIASDQKVGS